MIQKRDLLNDLEKLAFWAGLSINQIKIPEYITDNIRFKLFDWQEKALYNFLIFEKIKERNNDFNPTHLLFNMATGTGKTLLMACLILYYYKQGHKNFLFFVNQNNIVGKTEENFLNPYHNKYLFKENIIIDEKTVNIKQVNVFSEDSDDIQIIFTSIHKLHNAVHVVQENSIYLEDLQKKDIVMLGDEAHHLNATTKSKKNDNIIQMEMQISQSSKKEVVEKSWETTVLDKILKRGLFEQKEKNKNVLLEFTATLSEDKNIKEKYIDKIIYKFDLKDFLRAGYTKEINLVSSSFDKKQRILQALLFNWYRNEIALKHKIHNFKGVILFRSKFIETSKSDFEEFKEIINNLSRDDFNFLDDINLRDFNELFEVYKKGKSRIVDIKNYIQTNNITFDRIIAYLKDTFQKKRCIITNSETNKNKSEDTTDEQNRLLNSLEDKNNKITAIFTVQRLTEGWDVLNLFDIVRLYEGRDEGFDPVSKKRKAGSATVSEVQLIGRGVRYFPFPYENKIVNKRKFVDVLDNDLRILEEFYFHSDDNEKYISELKNELKNKGYDTNENKIIKKYELKESFKQTNFYKDVKLFYNERIKNDDRNLLPLEDIKIKLDFQYEISAEHLKETHIELEDDNDEVRMESLKQDFKILQVKLSSIDLHIIRKAINILAKDESSIFRFKTLKERLNIKSLEDIFNDNFFGGCILIIKVPISINTIGNRIQLDMLINFFKKLELLLNEYDCPFKGSEFKYTNFADKFDKVKEKLIEENSDDKNLEKELINKEWYALNAFTGTSEEIEIIEFIKNSIHQLEKKYNSIYLLRNEEVYTIYDFEKGRGFQPDFLLFLRKDKNLYYQIFIEPKGDIFLDSNNTFVNSKEGWKEKFLEEITEKYGSGEILNFENEKYKLIGLPFYNSRFNEKFKKKYEGLVLG